MTYEPLHHVLVALDGSDRSHEVIKYMTSAHLFKQNQTRVCLFSVHDSLSEHIQDLGNDTQFRKSFPQFQKSINSAKQLELQKKRDLEEFLEKCKTELVASGISDANITLKLQPKNVGIARDIIAESKNGYDAVMIGRKGKGVMKYVNLGSVAMKLLSGIKALPLALIGRDIPDSEKLLIAMDRSENSMKALKFTASTFGGDNHHIELIHVIREDLSTPPEVSEKFIGVVVPWLTEAKTDLLEKGFNGDQVSVKIATNQKSRAKAIIDEAENESIGTIITGRRGLNKVEEFFMGRVSNKIVQMGRFNAIWIVT